MPSSLERRLRQLYSSKEAGSIRSPLLGNQLTDSQIAGMVYSGFATSDATPEHLLREKAREKAPIDMAKGPNDFQVVPDNPGRQEQEQEADRNREIAHKRIFLKALRKLTGWDYAEVKSLAFPKGKLNTGRIISLVTNLHSLRLERGDLDLIVDLDSIDAEGSIMLKRRKYRSKMPLELDTESLQVLHLLKNYQETNNKRINGKK